MSENPLRRADQIRATSLLSSESDNERGGVGQSHLPSDGRPAREGRPLQMKEEKDSTKEAFDATALAEFLFGPGGRQAEAVLLPLRVPRDDRDRMQGGMDPGDEA